MTTPDETKNQYQIQFIHANDKEPQIIRETPEIPNLNLPFPPNVDIGEIVLDKVGKKQKSKSPNKFFIYRACYTKLYKESGCTYSMTHFSGFIGDKWSKESQEVKEYYENLAKQAKVLFSQLYPDRSVKTKHDDDNCSEGVGKGSMPKPIKKKNSAKKMKEETSIESLDSPEVWNVVEEFSNPPDYMMFQPHQQQQFLQHIQQIQLQPQQQQQQQQQQHHQNHHPFLESIVDHNMQLDSQNNDVLWEPVIDDVFPQNFVDFNSEAGYIIYNQQQEFAASEPQFSPTPSYTEQMDFCFEPSSLTTDSSFPIGSSLTTSSSLTTASSVNSDDYFLSKTPPGQYVNPRTVQNDFEQPQYIQLNEIYIQQQFTDKSLNGFDNNNIATFPAGCGLQQ